MAPRPDGTAPTSTPSPNASSSQSSAIPGLKRGIAIGVAASVAIILIALLTHFAIKRRKRLAAKKAKVELEAPAWPQEKKDNPLWQATPPPPTVPPVEADVRSIHELDAGQIPELPTKLPPQELEGDDVNTQELRLSGISHEQKLQQWKAWNLALQPEVDDAREREHETNRRDIPSLTLSVSPPDASLSPLGISPLGASPIGVSPPGGSSPLGVSPLEEAHFPPPNRRSFSFETIR